MGWHGVVVLTGKGGGKETQTFQLETQQYSVEDFFLVLFRIVVQPWVNTIQDAF